MRRLIVIGFLAAAAVGCGDGKTVVDPKPLTDEEKRKIQEDDRRIAEEESQGSVHKKPSKAPPAGRR